MAKNRSIIRHDNWKTPDDLFNRLNQEFSFDFDPCPLNHDIGLWDGLKISWGISCFVNPPYSRPLKDLFVKKAIEESKKGCRIVMLLPVSTSTVLFHEFIKPNAKEIRFLKGRIRFEGLDDQGKYSVKSHGQFDSMIVIF